MESSPLLGSQRSRQDARFWVRVRWGLLAAFWLAFAVLASFATILLVQAYKPPPPSVWHQRRVLCRHTGPPADVTKRIQDSSSLGCGGVVLAQEEVKTPGLRALVTVGKQYGVHIILEVQILEEYNGTLLRELKDAARGWMDDGASGFQLLGGQKATVMMVSQILQDEVEMDGGEERLILLPDWLCDDEDIPKNKSNLLRTCPIPDWNLQNVAVEAEMKNVAWKVDTGDMDTLGLRQFLAVTLPGTVILSLNQSLSQPTWLRSLLYLRFQNPALYAGWVQPTSNGSSYSAVSSWGCSALLVAISDPDQPLNVSLHLPYFQASARLILSTKGGRNQGQVLQDMVQLEKGEAQLLRLTPQ